ncbi:AMP-binding protein [Polycladomyces subterraneus]|uniref:AMP-binding protein n=1 Tax=Polycladomyces subterraneus TaxID=1016997 RepID=A0ABT8IIB2_9BACL|nr:AMP-binding protein [Polycladomyces subterraneus]MDN4592480.1 AMP-binding protein [Polycladomyces subterraneus]
MAAERFPCFTKFNEIGSPAIKGDRVALFLQNCPQYIICHYGVQKIGAIVGPCSPMFKEWELEYEVNDLGAKVIVTLDSLYPVVAAIREKTSLERVVVTRYADFLPERPVLAFPEPVGGRERLPETDDLAEILRTYPASAPEVEVSMGDVSLIVYTSGTTGLPKGAMLTYRNAQFKTDCLTRTFGYQQEDVSLAVMPIFHIAGMLNGVNVPIYTGGTTVLMTRYTPEALMEVVERYRVNVMYTIVPMNVAIMNHPRARTVDWSSLRLNPCTSFGIQLTKEISDQWQQLTGVPLFEAAYGLSETHTVDAIMPPDRIKYGTTGKPTFETEIKILSLEEPRRELPPGEEGEIVVKNPGVFKGYFNKPEATAETLRDGWVYTGDIGKLDEEGYLYFLGRVKEMIKCSGYSVFPEEVEQWIVRHPAVAQVAVIGVPDPVRGESVKAFIVLKPEYKGKVTEEDIISWSRFTNTPVSSSFVTPFPSQVLEKCCEGY